MAARFAARTGAWIALGLSGAGCATLPSLPPAGHPVAIGRIVDRIQCEVYETILDLQDLKDSKGRSWISHYAAKADLTLQVNTEAGATPEVALLGPFDTGTFSLGFGAGVTGTASRTAKVGVNIDFMLANPKWCQDKAHDGYPPLQGELGVREWLTAVLRSHNANDPFARPDSMSHRLDFAIEGNARISPAFSLTRSRGSGGFFVRRKDFHTLDIALVYLSPEKRLDLRRGYDTKVCVVNMPGPCFISGAAVAPVSAPQALQTFTAPAESRVEPAPRGPVRRRAVRRPRPQPGATEFPRDVQERLDRALQGLELRSIGPRQ